MFELRNVLPEVRDLASDQGSGEFVERLLESVNVGEDLLALALGEVCTVAGFVA
jgi:hypothetical protein